MSPFFFSKFKSYHDLLELVYLILQHLTPKKDGNK